MKGREQVVGEARRVRSCLQNVKKEGACRAVIPRASNHRQKNDASVDCLAAAAPAITPLLLQPVYYITPLFLVFYYYYNYYYHYHNYCYTTTTSASADRWEKLLTQFISICLCSSV